jgi:hypothetical protein
MISAATHRGGVNGLAKKKAELQADRDAYVHALDAARAAEAQGQFIHAIKLAIGAWPFADGMMQYERKYADATFRGVAAIDMVLKYAPMVFHYESLEALATLLKSDKRIERDTADDMTAKLAAARVRLWENHKLFSYLEADVGQRQDELRRKLGGDQDRWRAASELWEQMGLVVRVPVANSYRLSLATRLGQLVKAKCPHCGKVAEAPKAMLLDETTCPACEAKVSFVLLAGVN